LISSPPKYSMPPFNNSLRQILLLSTITNRKGLIEYPSRIKSLRYRVQEVVGIVFPSPKRIHQIKRRVRASTKISLR
jgi:hypothetical protein